MSEVKPVKPVRDLSKIPTELHWVPLEVDNIQASALVLITGFLSLEAEVKQATRQHNINRVLTLLGNAKFYAEKVGLSEKEFVKMATSATSVAPHFAKKSGE